MAKVKLYVYSVIQHQDAKHPEDIKIIYISLDMEIFAISLDMKIFSILSDMGDI